MALITVPELSAFMGKEFTASETTQAEAVIDAVSSAISAYTDQVFTPVVDEQITIQADGHGIIELNRRPIADVSLVTDINGAEIDSWEFDGLSAIYNLFPLQVVKVTYSYGYDTVPEDIKTVAKGSASRVMYNPAGLRQETVGAISVTYPGIGGEAGTINFSSLERMILDKYSRQSSSIRTAVSTRRVSGMPILTVSNNIA